MKKLFKLSKLHIYAFGLISNILPIIGLFILEGVSFEGLHKYQFWAWIAGAIYYTFVWVVAIVAYRKVSKQNEDVKKELELLKARIEKLEKDGK